MRILITGACGFVGSTLALGLKEGWPKWKLIGLDNLIRPGSELNRPALRRRGVPLVHGDIRSPSDLETLPRCDWILDAAANPSVLAGVDGKTSSRQLVEHNLIGTINLLERARDWRSGFLMLSTSRVYSVRELGAIPVRVRGDRFDPRVDAAGMAGLSRRGVAEVFSTEPPLSLYGSSKRASEILACEYADAFGLPVFVNRCGVLAGAGQFGRIDQGIFSFWIHSWRAKRPLKYIGFNGTGHQVRDCLHARDLLPLIARQMEKPDARAPRVLNVSGGVAQSASLRELSAWCRQRFGARRIARGTENAPVRRALAGVGFIARAAALELEAPNAPGNPLDGNCRARGEKPALAGSHGGFMNAPSPQAAPLRLLSVVIPARDEEGCIGSTVEHLHLELRLHHVPHEIVVVDDGSTDRTWDLLTQLKTRLPELIPVKNEEQHGFGRAILCGLDHMNGDAVVIMMADESDDCRDVVRYWEELNEGWDCVFGSRFMKGGGVIDYPRDQAVHEPAGQPVHPDAFQDQAQRHHQRLQGLPPRGDRRLPAA